MKAWYKRLCCITGEPPFLVTAYERTFVAATLETSKELLVRFVDNLSKFQVFLQQCLVALNVNTAAIMHYTVHTRGQV